MVRQERLRDKSDAPGCRAGLAGILPVAGASRRGPQNHLLKGEPEPLSLCRTPRVAPSAGRDGTPTRPWRTRKAGRMQVPRCHSRWCRRVWFRTGWGPPRYC